ncbi:TAXI family TRAP transporter solute-binding subunit [Chloroflexota bacterium]
MKKEIVIVKNRAFLLVSALLILVIFTVPALIACSTPAPSPTEHEIVEIDVLASAAGGSAYVMTFALAEIVKSIDHPWLRIRAVEAPGAEVNVRTMAERPELRKNTLFFSTVMHPQLYERTYQERGLPEYNTSGFIASFGATSMFFITLDEDIKTPGDLAGKRISLLSPTSNVTQLFGDVLDIGWGVYDQATIINGKGFGPGHGQLKDGLIDVALSLVNTDTQVPIPALSELLATHSPYPISIEKDVGQKVIDITGWRTHWDPVLASLLGPDRTGEFGTMGVEVDWFADKAMDDEIVTEICKVIYENIDKFQEYHAFGKAIAEDPNRLSPRAHIPEDEFHPAALKYWKEKGIKLNILK